MLPVALDSAEVMSFRARPHVMARTFSEVPDITADPYAYFLDSTSQKKYHDRLNERGLQPEGDPDRGHAFELKRHTIAGKLHSVEYQDLWFGTSAQWTNAFIWPRPNSASNLNDVHSGDIIIPAPYIESGLDAFAQQAYSRVAPSSVIFDAATFLGELREGLPRLTSDFLKRNIGSFKGLGSDYLNVEFGWKPFIRDIQNAAKALLGATNVLASQGKRVHRTYGLPATSHADATSFSGTNTIMAGKYRGILGYSDPEWGTSDLSSQTGYGSSAATHAKTRSSKRWFEGEFSTFYPLGFDPNDFFQRLNALIDVKIDPETLWELAPWSWLVDWNLRIGDSIAANQMAANDLLIMHYGYAMETAVYTTEVSWRLTGSPNGTYHAWSGGPLGGRYFASTTYKRRLRANPYGFKVGGQSSLTGGQAAILGALGLTKLK
jgi:hypothetical protein